MDVYFEEFTVGRSWTTRSRTVTEADVVNFAAYTGDYSEVHTSAAVAERSFFGQRVAHGMLGLAMAHGLLFRLGLLESSGSAFLGIDEWRFRAPIALGDTIHAVITVVKVRRSKSQPHHGVVTFEMNLLNHNGVVCQRGLKTILVKTREWRPQE